MEELKTCGIEEKGDLACGAAEDHRRIWCEIEVEQVTGSEKKKINIETASMQTPCVCVEFQRRLRTFGPKLGNIVSDHAKEFSAFLLKQASDRYFWYERTGLDF